MKSKISIFLAKIIILYLIWFVILGFFYETRFWHAINSIVLREVIFFSKYSLKLIGKVLYFTVQTMPRNGLKFSPHDTLLFYKGDMSYENYCDVFVDNQCLAIDLMYTFSVFLIAIWGPWKKKLWFIPLGILVINTLNILRIIGLGLTAMYYPKLMDFNHHLLFTYIVYFFTFILWVLWIKKYAKDDIIKIVEEVKEKEKQKKLSRL